MERYLICEKKGNRPRIHVKICEHRCPHGDVCTVFQEYLRTRVKGEMSPLSTRSEATVDAVSALVP